MTSDREVGIKSEPGVLQQIRVANVREIQSSYFQLLEESFAGPLQVLKSSEKEPSEVADLYASETELISEVSSRIEELIARMTEFWQNNANTIEIYLKSLRCLKALFGGEIFPHFGRGTIGSSGIYFDTTILHDPVLRIGTAVRSISNDTLTVSRLITHVLTLVRDFKEVILSDLDPPPFLVAPDPFAVDLSAFDVLREEAVADTLRHCSVIFNSEFATVPELTEFLSKISLSRLDQVVVNSERFLADILCERTPSKQLKTQLELISTLNPEILRKSSFADEIIRIFWGRFVSTNRDVYLSGLYSGVPIIEAPTSWEYLLWKNQYDTERGSIPAGHVSDDFLFAKVLQSGLNKELLVLNGLPPQALVQLRRQGAMSEVRQILRQNVELLQETKPEELKKVAKQVSDNLENAFEKHERELKDLESSKRQLLGWDLLRCLAVSSLGIAAACTNNAVLTASGAIATAAVGAPAVSDIWKKSQSNNQAEKKLRRSAAGILFKHLRQR